MLQAFLSQDVELWPWSCLFAHLLLRPQEGQSSFSGNPWKVGVVQTYAPTSVNRGPPICMLDVIWLNVV